MSDSSAPSLQDDLRTARRLAWWTIGWMASIIVLMGLVMGQSEAMRTAFIEDFLSVIPSIALLVAARMERKGRTILFPHGFRRAHSLAFLVAAVALTGLGAILLFEAVLTLAMREHVTIPSIALFGQHIWLGWLMIATLAYSVVPPFILGRLKQPVARRLHDEVMHTDALMQKADWMTGLTGMAGVLGIGFGLWWADAAAAAIIAFGILHDGIRALHVSAAELIDGAPRALDSSDMADDAKALCAELKRRWPEADIRLRESGRFILAQVHGAAHGEEVDRAEIWPCDSKLAWRFAELSFVPPSPQNN
jgi:cation diffusion facilitator family transporter